MFHFKVGTNYFENGVYKVGPSFPTNAYATFFPDPCIASIDDNTGVILLGKFQAPDSLFYSYSKAYTYNFTSNVWTKLNDTPFKIMNTNCQRVTLSSGKQVILVVGNYKLLISYYTSRLKLTQKHFILQQQII